MRNSLKRSYSLLSIALPVLFLGCGDSTSPAADIAVGNYTAVSFKTTSSSGIHDELEAGSTLVLNLHANGTTTGHLHIAPSTADPGGDADMAGTWTRAGTTVEFNQSADTFVRDTQFELTPDLTGSTWDLICDASFSGTRIQVTLQRN